MDLLPNDTQEQVIRSTAAFLEKELPVSRLHKPDAAHALSTACWQEMAQMGWFGMALPEEAGGIGFGLPEEVLLMREMGRGLAPLGVVGTILGAHVAVQAGAFDIVGDIIQGNIRCGLAMTAAALSSSSRSASDLRLWAVDTQDAVYVTLNHGESMSLVEIKSGGLRSVPCVDPSTNLAEMTLRNLPPLVVSSEKGQELTRRATLYSAALQVGLAEASRDMAVSYAKLREQFGKPIGAFQAIKHFCADMAVRCEAAWWQVVFAALRAQEGASDAAYNIEAAKVIAGRAAMENCRINIQIHGGIAMTDDHDAHLFLKRAHLLEQFFGTVALHQRGLLDQPSIN